MKNKEEGISIFIDDIHEYDYVRDELDHKVIIHSLFYSNQVHWTSTVRDTIAMQLTDNGDGFIISGENKFNKGVVIDYSCAEQLEILLRLVYVHNPSRYEIVEYKKIKF